MESPGETNFQVGSQISVQRSTEEDKTIAKESWTAQVHWISFHQSIVHGPVSQSAMISNISTIQSLSLAAVGEQVVCHSVFRAGENVLIFIDF